MVVVEAPGCQFPPSQLGSQGGSHLVEDRLISAKIPLIERLREGLHILSYQGSPRPRIQEGMEPGQEIPIQPEAIQPKDAEEKVGESREAGH